MKLTFILAPVPDLGPALTFYRDTLGYEEAWREGTDTVAFWLPGRVAQVMVVKDGAPAGPMFLVDSVSQWFADHPEVKPHIDPVAIPGGSVAGFRDPAGNISYVFDQPDA